MTGKAEQPSKESAPNGAGIQADEYYAVPAPLFGAILETLATMPYRDVANLMPHLQQVQKING